MFKTGWLNWLNGIPGVWRANEKMSLLDERLGEEGFLAPGCWCLTPSSLFLFLQFSINLSYNRLTALLLAVEPISLRYFFETPLHDHLIIFDRSADWWIPCRMPRSTSAGFELQSLCETSLFDYRLYTHCWETAESCIGLMPSGRVQTAQNQRELHTPDWPGYAGHQWMPKENLRWPPWSIFLSIP